jgi:HisJ family histidinol phosphate phosphatase
LTDDPRLAVVPDTHGHAKGEHKPFAEERPIPYTARMLFLWFYHACRRGAPRYLMVADHMNYLTFEDPAAVNLVRRALKLAQAGDLYGAAETAGVDVGHAAVVSEGLRKGMRYSIGAEVDNDPRSRPDAQNIVDAMRPDGMIRSVHFLPIAHPQHGENWPWPFDNAEFAEFYEVLGTERVWELYMATLLEAIEKLPGQIVGHFYVPAIFGHWPDDTVLEGYEDRLLDACLERGMAVEINSRYLYKHYAGDEAQLERFRSVHLRLMRKAKDKGVLVATGSDAHSPKDQAGAFGAILQMLDEAEINEIAFPINGRLARVALRATEEHLRQQVVAAASLPAHAEALGVSANGAASSGEPASEAEPVAETSPTPDGVTVKTPRPKAKRRPRPAAASPAAAGDGLAVDAPGEAEPAAAAEPETPEPVPVAAKPAAGKARTTPRKRTPKPGASGEAAAPAPVPAPAEVSSPPPAVLTSPASSPAKAPTAKKTAAPPKKAALPKSARPARVAAKKPAERKSPAAKVASPATTAKKAAVKKSAPKRSGPKKAALKKAAPKKATAARPPARPVKKSAPAKRPVKVAKRSAVAKRAAPKKAAKKSPAKKKSTRSRR